MQESQKGYDGLSKRVQWTQNNSELELRHRKKGREDGNYKGEQDGQESV
jgi:hypothetical protein